MIQIMEDWLLCSGAICGCRVSNRKYLLILTSVSEQ